MSKVIVTGADGRLAQHVIPILRGEGFSVVPFGSRVPLNNVPLIDLALRRISPPLSGLVHLAGGYWDDSDRYAWVKNSNANYYSFVNVIAAIEAAKLFGPYPSIVTVGSPFDSTSAERGRATAYYSTKASLDRYVTELNGKEQYAVNLRPSGPLDTPEKRDDFAFRILDSLTVPVRADYFENPLRDVCVSPKCFPDEETTL